MHENKTEAMSTVHIDLTSHYFFQAVHCSATKVLNLQALDIVHMSPSTYFTVLMVQEGDDGN
jgi:hypothetical protein